jgi:Raf kinase inhibitor-like YbhB/YbcL family protein
MQDAGLPEGTELGLNDFKKTAYGGPCPPIGRHRYFHKLYALDITLELRRASKAEIELAMKGHRLAHADHRHVSKRRPVVQPADPDA